MDQAVMVFAGTAARASALPSPEVGMTAYSTATGLQVYNGTAWVDVSTGYGAATLSGTGAGTATITVSSVSYTLLTAINDGTLSVSKAGLFDVCLVGGGGAGGRSQSNYGTSGGGGGGGIVFQTVYLAAGDYTVDVGAGGTGGFTEPYSGTGKPTSVYSTDNYEITALGGGCGAAPLYFIQPGFGGSGGGAKNNGTGGSTVQTQGSAGGNGGSSGAYDGGGGGGGGGSAVGANGSGSTGGNGGAGLDISTFLGQSGGTTIKGGGGGGGGTVLGSAGTGNGSANTGGGGVGRAAASSADGASGYSGIAYIRFR